jgi:hypothetical protein
LEVKEDNKEGLLLKVSKLLGKFGFYDGRAGSPAVPAAMEAVMKDNGIEPLVQ